MLAGRSSPTLNFAQPHLQVNDFDGSDDDGFHEPEAARRPHISAKQRRGESLTVGHHTLGTHHNDGGSDRDDMLDDDDDDGIPPLTNGDSDNDDPINSPTRHLREGRKGKSTGTTVRLYLIYSSTSRTS